MPIALILGLHGVVPAFIYYGGMLAFLAAAFWRPRIGLYFLVPLLPMQTVRYRLHDYPFGDQFIDIMLLGIVLGLIFGRDGATFVKTPLNKLIALVGVFLYVSLWHGSSYLGKAAPLYIGDPRFSDWKNYLVMPILFVIVAAVIRDARQMKILVFLMVLSFLLVNRNFYSNVSGRDLTVFSHSNRDAGPLGYAGENGFAAFEAQFMVFLLGLYAFQKNRTVKLVLLGVVGTGIYCLLYSFSRGGYLAFLLGLVFLGIFQERKWLIAVVVLLIAWQTILPASVQQRIAMTYDKEDRQLDTSAQARVTLWEDAVKLFHQNPIVGTGFNTYEYLNRVELEHGFQGGYYKDTHNYYLKVLVETGIPGLILFVWLLFRMFGIGFALYRTAEDVFLRSVGLGFAVMMVAAIVANLFGDRWTYMQVNCYLWILMGCVVRGQIITEQARQEVGVPVRPLPILPTPASRPRLA